MPPNLDHKALEAYLYKLDKNLAAIYTIAKNELTSTFQDRWCAHWPEGNDHGRDHINRVLDNLAVLAGQKPVESGELSRLDLFLSMMGVVAHDIGIVSGRKDHAHTSAKLIKQIAESNRYVFHDHTLDILVAAIVCHSSSVAIRDECGQFMNKAPIAGQIVQPYKITALVRLADELDEDFRRAPKQILEMGMIPKPSEPYWWFCQCIRGIDLGLPGGEILINAYFDEAAFHRKGADPGQSFFQFFAEKVAKINLERTRVVPYLEGLQRKRLVVHVNVPKKRRPEFFEQQNFYFDDEMGRSEAHAKRAANRFIKQYSEVFLGTESPPAMSGDDLLVELLNRQDAGYIVLVPPDIEKQRSPRATVLIEKWFAKSERTRSGIPRVLLERLDALTRVDIAERFTANTYVVSNDQEHLVVTFVELNEQNGSQPWALVLQEFPNSIPLPKELARQLTRTQLEVAKGLLKNWNNEQIAEHLGLSQHTVKTHVRNIYDRLNCDGRADFMYQAARFQKPV